MPTPVTNSAIVIDSGSTRNADVDVEAADGDPGEEGLGDVTPRPRPTRRAGAKNTTSVATKAPRASWRWRASPAERLAAGGGPATSRTQEPGQREARG